MKLSVIVCTRNRSHAVLPCLESVVQSLANAAPLKAEIVVINNASEDDTAAVLSQWASKSPFPVSLQFEPRKGASHARNCGLRAARGSLLVWTDDDCRLAPDYIATALKHDAADDAELVLRGGRVELGNASDFPISILTKKSGRRWHVKKYPRAYLSLGGAFIGANMMMRRALVDKLGLFDQHFGPGSNIPAGEETDYIYRAYAAGMMIEYDPALVVFHHHGRKSTADASKIMHNYMIAKGAVHAKHLFGNPLTYLPILWDIKGALRESVSGKNKFMPEIGFSYSNSLVCVATGTKRYLLARRG